VIQSIQRISKQLVLHRTWYAKNKKEKPINRIVKTAI